MLRLGRFPRVPLGHLPPRPGTPAASRSPIPAASPKAMAGLIDLVRMGRFGKDEGVVFVHTGGQAGLFAHEPTFAA